MRRLPALLLCVAAAAAAEADDWFELGLDYLRKGFYGRARAAFAESLAGAPGEPVPLAFLGVAAAAEGRAPKECAAVLRQAYRRLPAGKALRLDLRPLLPAPSGLAALERDYASRLARAAPGERRPVLDVLAFLQVHDGDPATAPALEILRREAKGDPYAAALFPAPPQSERPE
jgi:hypothetical protein